MTPYEQAKYYDNYLPFDERARWIVTSNFSEIWIYDRNADKPEPIKIGIADLQSKYHMLDFLVNKKTKEITEEVELSKAAGELVGKIRDRFLTQYNDPLAKRTQKSLNVLCVRLVFCYYAEDAGLFGARDAFSSYLMQYQPKDMRGALIELFKTLDTPPDERADLYLSDEPAAFPYVNGGLFSDENIVIPKITQEIKDSPEESGRFDRSRISPTIFGAVFESTLNPETRRAGGMHYTSIENIHKVIDPLFLDDLKEEPDKLRKITVPGTQKKKLDIFQDKLASLVFLENCTTSLIRVAAVKSEEYYVNMMIAWYFATALAKQYELVLPYLEEKKLDDWVHNKAIQKSIESYRITDEQKVYLRSLKVRACKKR